MPRFVAQIFNLLYRRIAFGRAFERSKGSVSFHGPQIANLRYSRLQICATPKLRAAAMASVLFCLPMMAQQTGTNASPGRFQAVDVFVDSQGQPLAAYQLELSFTNAGAKIVGIEGGEHPAFAEAPFYDPQAMQHERVIIAAFSTNARTDLPSGRTRVATIHVQTAGAGEVKVDLKLRVAAGSEGNRIPAEATVAERKAK
jgi:hypothetical protein